MNPYRSSIYSDIQCIELFKNSINKVSQQYKEYYTKEIKIKKSQKSTPCINHKREMKTNISNSINKPCLDSEESTKNKNKVHYIVKKAGNSKHNERIKINNSSKENHENVIEETEDERSINVK